MTKQSQGAALVAQIRSEMADMSCVPTSTEEALLTMAEATADRIERLESIISRDGELITSPTGVLKTHPSVAEVRQQRAALARILGGIYIGDNTSAGKKKKKKKNPTKQRAGLRSRDLKAEPAG